MKPEELSAFPIGEPNDAFAQYFIGQSYLAPLTLEQIPTFNVTFSPACRNNWHIHHAKSGGGQLLVCVYGKGWYQEWGKEPRELHPGDVVNIPPNVKHWHGAAADSWFQHIAQEIPGEETRNEWCEPVTDEEYKKLKETDRKTKIVQTAGRDSLGEFAPDFAHFNDDILFGENWNNEDLNLKTRSLITVVALMSQGITDSSLKYHILNAKNHGVTQKEMAAAITHVAFYAGWPKAWAVFNLAKEVYQEV